ncbi:hypothetical protein OTU49_013888, partial [Cherax quadricarinatus]
SKTKEIRVGFPLKDFSLQKFTLLSSLNSSVYSLWAVCGQRNDETGTNGTLDSTNTSLDTTVSSVPTDIEATSTTSFTMHTSNHTTASCIPYSAFYRGQGERWRHCGGQVQEEHLDTLLQDSHPTILFYIAQN